MLTAISGPPPPSPLAGLPPIVFVSMDQDPAMAARISADAARLRARGGAVATVRVAPRVVGPSFFSDRRRATAYWGALPLCGRCQPPGVLGAPRCGALLAKGCPGRPRHSSSAEPSQQHLPTTAPNPSSLLNPIPQIPPCSSHVSPETSARVVQSLHEIGMLDERGYVTVDPR